MGKFRFLFVIVSKNSEFKLSEQQIEDIRKNRSYSVQVEKISNNQAPLTEVYNKYLKLARQSKNFDFVVLMHADVSLDLTHFCQHLIECNEKYDVFGLCGTSVMNVSQSPLNWWTGSNPTPQSKWGCVTHGELGNQTSFFNRDRQNITDHEVSCIDGLCIVLGFRALNSQIEFDESFLFDFYDTDFSFQAIMKWHLRLGVIVETSLQHYSVGKSILDEDFLKHELDFRKKWNLEIPKGSALERLVAKI